MILKSVAFCEGVHFIVCRHNKMSVWETELCNCLCQAGAGGKQKHVFWLCVCCCWNKDCTEARPGRRSTLILATMWGKQENKSSACSHDIQLLISIIKNKKTKNKENYDIKCWHNKKNPLQCSDFGCPGGVYFTLMFLKVFILSGKNTPTIVWSLVCGHGMKTYICTVRQV